MLKIASFLRNSFRKKRMERDLDDEIRFYLETTVQNKMALGMSEEEARRAARLELGSVDSLKDSVRDIRTGAMAERIWQDVRYACRALRHKPAFTAVAVMVLALGIGANSAVFSLINAFFLKPLAVAKPEELVSLYSRDAKHPDSYRAFSYPNYLDIRDSQAAFSSVTAQISLWSASKRVTKRAERSPTSCLRITFRRSACRSWKAVHSRPAKKTLVVTSPLSCRIRSGRKRVKIPS